MNDSDARRVLALQYWAGDRDDALKLARFISDLQGKPCPQVDFAFIVRDDAQPPDEVTIKKVARYFNVEVVRSPHHGTGHPDGCWVLWFAAVEWLLKRQEAGGPPIKWALTFESDCTPATKDWLDKLDAGWDARANDAKIVGHSPGGKCHINGNLMVSGDRTFLEWLVRGVTVRGVPSMRSWDIYLFPSFIRWGCSEALFMRSTYRMSGASTGFYKRLVEDGVVFHHGCKDDSLLRLVRRDLLGSATQV